MAVLLKTQKPPVTINSADTYNFGNAGSGEVSTTMFHLVSSSFSGSITVKGRAMDTENTFAEIPYRALHLNGAVSDGSEVDTAITDTSIIEVDSTGLDVALDCTSYTSGTMAVTPKRVQG